MRSHLTKDFRMLFRKLPERIQRQAKKNYRLWKKNPFHPSLEFKPHPEYERLLRRF